MKEGLYVLAVVPARGGTDTVPYLNIKKLGDRALLAHTLEAARAAPSIDRLVVSTDDERVQEVARRDRRVARFGFAAGNQGGSGVTVLEFGA